MSERVVVKWTPAAMAAVYAMWEQDFSGTEIAERIVAEHGLAVTKSSVIGIAFRAGMAGRAPRSERSKATSGRIDISPEERRDRDRARKAVRSVERAAARAAKPISPPRPLQAPRPVAVARPEPAGIAPSLRPPLVAIRDGQCRFIAGDPVYGDGTCCGHAVAEGSRWCPGHHAVCCTPARRAVSMWMATRRAA